MSDRIKEIERRLKQASEGGYWDTDRCREYRVGKENWVRDLADKYLLDKVQREDGDA